MISFKQREAILAILEEAVTSGARQHKACEIIGINPKTLQRWKTPKDLQDDGRKTRVFIPTNKLTDEERQRIISVVNSDEFCAMTPNQIVPILAERGEYIASERTYYRVLKDEGQLAHRHRARPGAASRKPDALCASAPGQLLSWDITYLKTSVLGQFFYLYLFMDVFSRKIVGWQIHDRESSQLAAEIVRDIARQEGYDKNQVNIHSDNGSPMKGATLLATYQTLGITPSYSRPSVSNDNPYSESMFKTLKYCPYFPKNPFRDLQEARQWMSDFEHWYNHDHRHSGINYVTPEQRHVGVDRALLVKRSEVYEKAKAKHPARWAGRVRNWRWQEEVLLNPGKKIGGANKETRKLAA